MFKNPEDYPFIKEIESNFHIIREEYDKIRSMLDLHIDWKGKDVTTDGQRKIFGAYNDGGLKIIGLRWYRRTSEQCAPLFPKTHEIFNRLAPGLSLLVFSKLDAHKTIEPHRGDNTGSLRGLMGIKVPEKCVLGVNSEIRPIQEGKCLIFDDTELHYAWNDSDEERITLIFDFGESYFQNKPNRELDVIMKMHDRVWKRKLNGIQTDIGK